MYVCICPGEGDGYYLPFPSVGDANLASIIPELQRDGEKAFSGEHTGLAVAPSLELRGNMYVASVRPFIERRSTTI